jgi:glutamate dehydrogenase/leucine dehydrogenase
VSEPRPNDLLFWHHRLPSDVELWKAVDDSSSNPLDHIYSCVALYTRDWHEGWPALGGTRWVQSETDDPARWREEARHQAIELAMAMYNKNTLLRRAAEKTYGGESSLFNWQGGKGVIWTPYGAQLTPHRLRCHGLLIEHLAGRYVGSKDKGVGTSQLEEIAKETRHTIGLGCGRDTGEATAYGVLAGLKQSVVEIGMSAGQEPVLAGLAVLVVGAGKVGLPLVQLLESQAARVFVYDPELEPGAIESWFRRQQQIGAAVDERHLETLRALAKQGRVLSPGQEAEALRHPEVQIVSPNGGSTEWLQRSPAGSGAESRAKVLAAAAKRHRKLRLVLGAGNDQLSATTDGAIGRAEALEALTEAGILFIPDPLVSPGGVIAVSHERADQWNAEAVNLDTTRIVTTSVIQAFRTARSLGELNSLQLYRAFENLVAHRWD